MIGYLHVLRTFLTRSGASSCQASPRASPPFPPRHSIAQNSGSFARSLKDLPVKGPLNTTAVEDVRMQTTEVCCCATRIDRP